MQANNGSNPCPGPAMAIALCYRVIPFLEKSVNKYWVLVMGRLVGGRVTPGLYFYVRCGGWRNSVEWVETRDTVYG